MTTVSAENICIYEVPSRRENEQRRSPNMKTTVSSNLRCIIESSYNTSNIRRESFRTKSERWDCGAYFEVRVEDSSVSLSPKPSPCRMGIVLPPSYRTASIPFVAVISVKYPWDRVMSLKDYRVWPSNFCTTLCKESSSIRPGGFVTSPLANYSHERAKETLLITFEALITLHEPRKSVCWSHVSHPSVTSMHFRVSICQSNKLMYRRETMATKTCTTVMIWWFYQYFENISYPFLCIALIDVGINSRLMPFEHCSCIFPLLIKCDSHVMSARTCTMHRYCLL